MSAYEFMQLVAGVGAVLSFLAILVTSDHANQQRSAIESKLDWILSRQADQETRLSVLESQWSDYDPHPSRPRRPA